MRLRDLTHYLIPLPSGNWGLKVRGGLGIRGGGGKIKGIGVLWGGYD